MIGLGTIINVIAILIGSAIGVALGHRLPQRTRDVVTDGVGLAVLLVAALSAAAVLSPAVSEAVGRLRGADRARLAADRRDPRLAVADRGAARGAGRVDPPAAVAPRPWTQPPARTMARATEAPPIPTRRQRTAGPADDHDGEADDSTALGDPVDVEIEGALADADGRWTARQAQHLRRGLRHGLAGVLRRAAGDPRLAVRRPGPGDQPAGPEVGDGRLHLHRVRRQPRVGRGRQRPGRRASTRGL